MKILAAGGAGYIGSVLVPMLAERGYDVRVIDSLWFGNSLPKEIDVIEKDLFKCTAADFKGVDQVIFLAGLSNDPMAEFSPALNFVHNAALPTYLAYAAKKAGVRRFIYASTCSVYGYAADELYDESMSTTCAYPYGIAKLQGEMGVQQLCAESFSVITLRQGTVCGYSPRMRFDLIVNTMYKSAMVDGTITVNNPSIWRPLIDVRDTSSAFIRAVQAAETISGTFNIGGGNFTVGQVGDLVRDQVQELTGRSIKLNIKDIKDFRNYKVSMDLASTELGFEARYSIEDLIRDLHAHVDEYGDFQDEKYYNIQVFKAMNLG